MYTALSQESERSPFTLIQPEVKRGAQGAHHEVYVYLNVFSVSAIDTVEEKFDCHSPISRP